MTQFSLGDRVQWRPLVTTANLPRSPGTVVGISSQPPITRVHWDGDRDSYDELTSWLTRHPPGPTGPGDPQ